MSDDIRLPRTETEIAERGFAQADKLGLKLKTVRIKDAGPVHGALGVSYIAGILAVSKRAAYDLTDEELDFAMTFAMAITPGIMMGYMFLVSVVTFVIVYLVGNAMHWPIWMTLLIWFALNWVAVTVTSRLNLQNEQNMRLKKALKVTGDRAAAKSYIEKYVEAQSKVLKGKLPEQLRENLMKSLEASSD